MKGWAKQESHQFLVQVYLEEPVILHPSIITDVFITLCP